jgi:crotonobetainyl-CoA:carnitine CoA-transferase CaiB-like acyl-CoA transferase
VSVTPATSGGPLADLPSFDLLAQARSGFMGVTGDADGPPTKVGTPVADVLTGLYGAVALLAGLFARATSRPGRHFEVPLLESTMSALINQAQGFLATNENPRRLGNDHPSITPYGPVTTADGFLLLAVGTDAQFAKLVEVLDAPALTARADWRDNDSRVRDRDELRAHLNAIFVKRTTDEWLRVLEPSGVPFAPILDVAGAFAQDQIAGGDFVGPMSTPAGEVLALRTPLVLDGVRPSIRRGPRRMGEDNEEIFGD